MKILVDPHVHTIASGHAYSTLNDYIEEAKSIGLEMFALTDHATSMPGASDVFHFYNQVVIPREVDGVKILRGIEANVVGFDGTIDVSNKLLKRMDLIIGSFHPICFPAGTKAENTRAYVEMMKRDLIQIIGHPGNLHVEVDIEEIVRVAKFYDVLIEINNSTFKNLSRRGSDVNCERFIEMGLKHDIEFSVSSDAHIRYELGRFEHSISKLEKYAVPIEKIANANAESMIRFLKRKGKLLNEFD
jgi:putative hydrolase